MTYPRELESQSLAWALFVAGAIFLFRYLALELIAAIGACVFKVIELRKMVREKRAADR
jgi:hypothetical protein